MLTSKVTSGSQTTLPGEVRKALGLQPGMDSIHWEIRGNEAVVRRAVLESVYDDPALLPFLHFLEQDVLKQPEHL
jgi:bifunctional DNA-binding transcriptional regulator/antitoxin component of YhaV-PrlF toxin-antitoxin module